MTRNRSVQHRATREGRRARELADLKKAQHQLEVKAQRLQEALEKPPRPKKERPAATGVCPGCGGPTSLVNLGRFEMLACPACKWHQKKT